MPIAPIDFQVRKRRWLSFTLRGLLLVTLVIACLLGWKMYKVNLQRRAVSKVKELGGTVFYNTDAALGKVKPRSSFEPPAWLHRFLGNDFFDYVVAVRLKGPQVEDVSCLADLPTITDINLSGCKVADLSPLAGLTDLKRLILLAVPVRNIQPLSNLIALETLSLENTQVEDIAPLSKLVNLQALALDGTPVSDLSPLKGMTKLIELKLFFCPNVRDVQPLAGLTKLQYLDLSDSKVSDIKPLHVLSSLAFLSLSRTAVPPEETKQLQSSLPTCQVMQRQ